MKRLLLFCAFVLAAYVSHAYRNTYAVIVGIADYRDYTSTTGDLSYTVNDAVKFREFLMSSNGGSVPAANICLLTDARATRERVLYEAKRVFAMSDANDRVIFFFSGHGNRGVFFLYDDVMTYGDLKSVFKKSKSRYKLLFADACYAGNVKTDIKNHTTDIGRDKSQQIAMMLACSDGEKSIESNVLRQGAFSYYLINGLAGYADENKNGNITIRELFKYVKYKTMKFAQKCDSRQTPVLFGNFDLNLIIGRVNENASMKGLDEMND